MLHYADNSDDAHYGVHWRLRKSDDDNVGILVCPKPSRNEVRAQRYDGNKPVALSQPSIRNLDMKSGIVRLGHPDSEGWGVLTIVSGDGSRSRLTQSVPPRPPSTKAVRSQAPRRAACRPLISSTAGRCEACER